MRKVFQTKFKAGEGDCLAACLATIMGLPLDAVPNFCLNPDWVGECNRWLQPYGYGLLVCGVDRDNDNIKAFIDRLRDSAGFYIVTGPSPDNGLAHAVVYQGPKLYHDPCPGGDGVAVAVDFLFLVALNPCKPPRPPADLWADKQPVHTHG